MFHRDHGAAEEDSSIDPRIWPSHFRRATAGSDHFPRKSSDQVIQQLRDELDKHRQMFFNRLPTQWESTSPRTGFPFTDSARRAFSGAERTTPHHHAFEDSIPAWMMEDDVGTSHPFSSRQRWPSGGSARSGGSNHSSGSAESATNPPTGRSDSPSRPRMHKPAARSATGDFPSNVGGSSPGVAASSPPTKGFCRASSAPPVAPQEEFVANNSGTPRRSLFTTTVHHTPNSGRPTVAAAAAASSSTSSPGPTRRQQHQHVPSNGPNVRHIPIMVEGRDDPVLPSVVEEDSAAKELRSKTAIPMPFYPTKSVHHPSPSASGDKKIEKSPVRDTSIPIPLPYDRLSDDSGRSIDSTDGPMAAPVNNQQQPKPVQEEKTPTQIDLELIARIQRETETLLPRIEAFKGDRSDRGFLFLDEMLTRLLLKLDNVQVEGRDDVRQARKEAISSITRCINLLESKILDSIGRAKSNEPSEPMEIEEQPNSVAEKEAASVPEHQEQSLPEVSVNDAEPSSDKEHHVSQLVINLQDPTSKQ